MEWALDQESRDLDSGSILQFVTAYKLLHLGKPGSSHIRRGR